jgi:hypothetical protein
MSYLAGSVNRSVGGRRLVTALLLASPLAGAVVPLTVAVAGPASTGTALLEVAAVASVVLTLP